MKKATKLLAVMMVAVLFVGLLAGCSLFSKNTVKLRALTVAKVGNEEIKLGRVLDMYNANYYNYYTYVANGYLTLDSLFSMTMDSLYSTYMKVDAYKSGSPATYQHGYVGTYANSQYLTKEEVDSVIKSVKYSLFSGLDSYVENYVTTEVGELGDTSADTSRDFYKPEDMGTATTYAEKVYNDSLANEDADEYFEKYYVGSEYKATYSDYVQAQNSATTAAKVADINERLAKYVDDNVEEDEVAPEITAEQYVNWQNRAMRTYTRNVDENYGLGLTQLVKEQIESYVVSIIASKYDLSVSSAIESAANWKTEVADTFASVVKATEAQYAMNPSSFESFVSSLSNTSYIYAVPEKYQGSYIFVKNLLIPFNDSQLAELANLQSILGSESDEYKAFRTQLAAEIVAKDFDNDEAEVKGLFAYEGGELKLAGTLAEKLPAGGTVTQEEFTALMKQYNTDTGSHANYYDYVVRVGHKPSSYTSSWVKEFDEAATAAYEAGLGHYAVTVSSYGVHVVYYSGNVEAMAFDPANMYDTSKPEYNFMKQVYNDKLSFIQTQDTDNLNETYKYAEDRKISLSGDFKTLLKYLGITYDFDAAMADPDAEADA